MKVAIKCFACGNGPHNNFALSELRRLIKCQSVDRYKIHTLVNDVDQADIVILVGPQIPTMLDFRRSEAWKKYSEKCFVYYGGDRALPLLPGIYVSLERRFYARSWTRSASYLRVAENTNIESSPFDCCDLLYSFSGAISNHPARKRLLHISHERGVILDTSNLSIRQRQRDGVSGPGDTYTKAYASFLARSKFILCPRGIGVSSWRLFETLKAGRVPVIISDQWVPPEGPDWNRCSIRIAETDVSSIPTVLARREDDAAELARVARATWDEWFAADVLFHRIVEWCLAIKRERRLPAKLQSALYCMELARPFYFRHWLLRDLRHLALGK